MNSIENRFHKQIDHLSSSLRDHDAISEYFMLWWIRFEYKINPPEDFKLSVDTEEKLSKEDEEKVEKVGMIFCRERGILPARFFVSGQIFCFRPDLFIA